LRGPLQINRQISSVQWVFVLLPIFIMDALAMRLEIVDLNSHSIRESNKNPQPATFIVEFQPEGRRIQVEKGSTILDAARTGGIAIRSICGGVGTCGKCVVIVQEGRIGERSKSDRKFISQDDASRGYHLACQTHILSDTKVTIPPETRVNGQQILATAHLPKVGLDPFCHKLFLKFRPVAQEKSRQIEQLSGLAEETLGQKVHLSERILLKLDRLSQISDGLTLIVNKRMTGFDVIDIDLGDTTLRSYGLAVDIGTTKVVAYLVDINDGEIIAVESEYNEQLTYGEDLLSRIDYAFRDSEGLSKLQKAVVNTINKILKTICSKAHIEPSEIVDVSIGGNTIMTYLLAGTNPVHLVDANARVSRDSIQKTAQEIGVTINPAASIFCLPNVSRFVGGDVVADVLVSEMHQSTQISVLIDLGTNGEIVIGSKGWLFSTSCAAGPAFEGWDIRFGMRSVEGAIEHVKIDRTSLKSNYTVIGGLHHKARGICGSGMIDALAEMYRSGIVDSLGRILDERKPHLVREGSDGMEYVVSPASENDLGKDIVLTQRDLSNLIDSKAAVCGSVAVLMKKVGVSNLNIGSLYLAGAFGNYVDPVSAVTVGIFPEFPNAKIVQIGNGSVAGAYLALLSQKKRIEAKQVADIMTYYDLTIDPDFMEEYNAALSIPGRPELFPSSRR